MLCVYQFPLHSMVGWPQPCLFLFVPLCLLLWVLTDCRVEHLLYVYHNVCFFILFFLLLKRSLPQHFRKYPQITSFFFFFLNLDCWLYNVKMFQESPFSWHHIEMLTFFFLKLHLVSDLKTDSETKWHFCSDRSIGLILELRWSSIWIG